MSDSSAFVYDDASLTFQICNQLPCCARPSRRYQSSCRCVRVECGESRTIVPRRLEDTDALRNCCASEALVIRRVNGRQERDVHTEGLVRLSSRFANCFAQCVGVRLGERRENAYRHIDDV